MTNSSWTPTLLPAPTTRRGVVRALTAGTGVTAATFLAACGTQGAPGAGRGGASSSARLGPNGFTFKQPVELTYWKSLEGPRHEAQVKLTNDFNASRSDVKVNLEHVGTYAEAAQKLTTVLAANTPPDVMMLTVDTFMPVFARLGALHPLDEFTRSDKGAKFETYVPGFIKNATINGKLWQIPLARSTPVLYYNKDHFKATGLPETAPSSWDDVLAAAQKLTRSGVIQADTTDNAQLAFPVAGYWWTFQSIAWAFGGKLSDEKFTPTVTQPETVQAMQFLADMVQRSKVARAYRTVGASGTAFRAGQLSFLVESTAVLTQTEEGTASRVGAAFMPQQKQRAVPGGGSGLSIINSIPVEKKEASWEFMKSITTTPNTVYFSKATGYMVVRTDAEKNPEYQQYLQQTPNAKVTFDQMQFVRTQDSIAEINGSTTAIEDAIRAVMIEGKNVKATMDELQRTLGNLAAQAPK